VELEGKTAQLVSQTAQLQQAQSDLKAQSDSLAAQNAALAADKQALQKQAADKQAQYDSLVGDLKKEVNDGQLKITQYKNMLTVDVADKILFDSGKADLKADGKAVLKKVAEALAKGDKVIRVVGHTDNVRLGAGAAFASNWELSTARATKVVRFLNEQGGLDPKRLIAEGRGEYSPVAPNDTPENKQRNRRIEITLLDRSLVDAVVLSPTASAAAVSGSAK
jgi:chemotaxis protein MotB